MLSFFLNQTGTVSQITTTLSGGEEVRTETNLYTSIPCYYYKSGTLKRTDLAENTDMSQYSCLVEASRTGIKKGMFIDITDPDIGVVGKYKIEDVKVNRMTYGNIDSLQLVLGS